MSNLPPGCSYADIPGVMADETCDVCKKDAAECICPTCPQCGEAGNMMCYESFPGQADGHMLKLNRGQVLSRHRYAIAVQEARLQEAKDTFKRLAQTEDWDPTEYRVSDDETQVG